MPAILEHIPTLHIPGSRSKGAYSLSLVPSSDLPCLQEPLPEGSYPTLTSLTSELFVGASTGWISSTGLVGSVHRVELRGQHVKVVAIPTEQGPHLPQPHLLGWVRALLPLALCLLRTCLPLLT